MLLAQGLLAVGHEAVAHRHTKENAHGEKPDTPGHGQSPRQLLLQPRLFENLPPALGQRIERVLIRRTLLHADKRRVFADFNAANRREVFQPVGGKVARHDDFGKGLHATKVLRLEKRQHDFAAKVAFRADRANRARQVAVNDQEGDAVRALHQQKPPFVAAADGGPQPAHRPQRERIHPRDIQFRRVQSLGNIFRRAFGQCRRHHDQPVRLVAHQFARDCQRLVGIRTHRPQERRGETARVFPRFGGHAHEFDQKAGKRQSKHGLVGGLPRGEQTQRTALKGGNLNRTCHSHCVLYQKRRDCGGSVGGCPIGDKTK